MKQLIFSSFILCSTLLDASSVSFSETETNKGKAEAKTLSGSMMSTYGNSGGLNSRVFNPMTSETEMHTVDNQQSAVANIRCQSSENPFARISYSGTSDITINIKLDLDTNGAFEKNINFSGVSGIHASGVITCSPNSFTNCSYYNWSFNSGAKTIELSQVQQHESRGSYCINSSCGSPSATQKNKILEDITASVGATLQQSSHNYIITRTFTSNTHIDLYGQDQSNCSNSSNTIYTASIGGAPSSAQLLNEAEAAKTESNEGYYILSKSTENQQQNVVDNSELTDILAVSAKSSEATVDPSDPSKINYTAKYKDENGNWIEKDDSSKMAFDTLTKGKDSCMVEWEEISTEVTSDGKVKGHTTSGVKTMMKTEIRECTGENNDICPVNSNESIKYNCGNLDNSMAEAAGAFGILETMTKDMTCSTN